MAYRELYFQKKWFDESTPRNPKKATATLTFIGVVDDAQTVTIGSEIYEFKASGNAEEGNIKVDISSGVTADIAVVKLKEVINATSSLVTAVASTEDDTVVVTYNTIGTGGNEVEVATDCTNGSWGEEVTTLSKGLLGTPCMTRDIIVYVAPYYYWCDKEGSDHTVSWKRFTPATY